MCLPLCQLLAKYIIINKLVCIFFLVMHLVMCFFSALNLQTPSYITTESLGCRFIFPLKNLVHLILNIILCFLFAGSILNVKTITDLTFYEKSRKFGIILIMFSTYNVFLKFLNRINCMFWEISWYSVIGNMGSFFLEGLFIFMFFQWYHDKVLIIRDTMITSIRILNTKTPDKKDVL